MRWTRKGIIEEIRRLHAAGEELNYKAVEENHLNLVRAASWHFGTWKRAIEKSGLDYDDVSKYQKWSRERVVARIKELYNEGKDLSWRAISTEVDPPLAAAALRENSGFESWYEAITAAGLNHDEIARYRRWTKERVLQEILDRNKNGLPMSSIAVQRHNSPLYCAAKRRFLQWDNALRTAGLDPDKIRIRKAPEAAQPRRRRGAAGALDVPVAAPVPASVVRPSSRRRNSDIPTLDQAVAMLQPESNGAPEIAPVSEKPRRGRKPVVPAQIVAPIVEAKVATNGTAPKGKKTAAKAAPPVVETPVAPAKPTRGRKAAAAPVVEEAPVKPTRGRKAAPAPVVEEAPVKPTRGRKAVAPVVEAPAPAPAKPARGKAAVAPAPAAIAATAKGKKAAAATPAPAPAKAPAKKAAKAAAPVVEVPAAPVKPARGRKAAAAPVVEEAPAKPARKTAKAAPVPAPAAKTATAKAPAKAAAKAAPAAKPATTKAAKAAPAPEPAVAAKPARGKAAKVEAPAPAPAKKAKAEKVQAAAPVAEKKSKKESKADAAKKPKDTKAKKKK